MSDCKLLKWLNILRTFSLEPVPHTVQMTNHTMVVYKLTSYMKTVCKNKCERVHVHKCLCVYACILYIVCVHVHIAVYICACVCDMKKGKEKT